MADALAMSWTYWDPDNLSAANTIARVVGYAGIGAGALGVLFALFGLLRGVAGRQPLGACVGGLMLSLLGLVMMVLLTIVIGIASREFDKEMRFRRPGGERPAPMDGRFPR